MCHQCDYSNLFKSCGLDDTPNRLHVMEVVGNSSYPLSAQEVFDTVTRTAHINRVTVYRILDVLVEKGLLDRISGGDRSFRYGIAPNENHRPHAHFYCKLCGNMECLSPESVRMNMESLKRSFPGLIEKAEIRIDGVCKNCLKAEKEIG